MRYVLIKDEKTRVGKHQSTVSPSSRYVSLHFIMHIEFDFTFNFTIGVLYFIVLGFGVFFALFYFSSPCIIIMFPTPLEMKVA